MSASNLSPSTTSNLPQSALAWSGLKPSALALVETEQSASSFEAMLSTYSLEDKTDPFALRDVLGPDVGSTQDVESTSEDLQQHPLDLLPPHMRAAIVSMGQDQQPSAIDSQFVSPAPVPSSRITWNGGSLTKAELQIVAVLNRHKDQCPLSWESLGDKANDPSTPPDLKAAIEGLQQDPELFYAIGSQGDGRCGGKITAKDLSGFSRLHSQVAEFQERQAQSYDQNYIPSDSTGNAQPSIMTLSDALRELYLYSDNLPKDLSPADFKQIVDGQAKTDKCPPQVIAAAQYFLNHPDAWKQLCGGATDRVHKEDFLQAASSSMSLTRTELDTLKTINSHQDAFFGGGDLTRDKLASMADNKSLDPKVRQTASQLLSDPLLFGLLNNSITGYTTHNGFFDFGGGHTVDSGNVSKKDFARFYTNMSSANRTVQQPKTHMPETAAEQDAVADMRMGLADQPDIKSSKKNGGALMHVVDSVLKVEAQAIDWAATAVGVLSFIPGIGQVADLASMVLESESQAANLLHTAISGGNMKRALEEAGLNVAAQAVGLVAGPEVKLAIRNGLIKEAMEEALTAGVNLPLSTAQYYAEGYMNNLQARLAADPVQAAGLPSQMGAPLSQNVA
ncbi:HrpF/NolX family T3SS translocon protein [Mesorhizobium shangrilense]|uniref:HrpF/NolX family T3SS translocon protein n=1 Tax=Mesorhizobium shangrilense TaxID=460060 RepID=A0ABV2DR85_9HYPH